MDIERTHSYPLIHSSDARNGWDWSLARAKAWNWEYSPGLSQGWQEPITCAVTALSPLSI